MAEVIDSFSGEYRFLSNFYPARIVYLNNEYATTEHAYQAAKATNAKDRARIRKAQGPGMAKKLGRKIKMRSDFEGEKIGVMRCILRLKFGAHKDLREKLLATGNAQLIEGNHWGDVFWGVCRGRGKNWLGKLLMEVRKELANG